MFFVHLHKNSRGIVFIPLHFILKIVCFYIILYFAAAMEIGYASGILLGSHPVIDFILLSRY